MKKIILTVLFIFSVSIFLSCGCDVFDPFEAFDNDDYYTLEVYPADGSKFDNEEVFFVYVKVIQHYKDRLHNLSEYKTKEVKEDIDVVELDNSVFSFYCDASGNGAFPGITKSGYENGSYFKMKAYSSGPHFVEFLIIYARHSLTKTVRYYIK